MSKKISVKADILLQKCRLILMEKTKPKRKSEVAEYKIIEDALRLYYAYLKGLIPEDVVTNALQELIVEEEVGLG